MPCPGSEILLLSQGSFICKVSSNITITYSHVTPFLLINRISSQYSPQLPYLHLFFSSALVAFVALVFLLKETAD